MSGYKIYEAVNSNLLGLNIDERKTGDYQLHPLIRDDWRSVDKYRDLQGNVPALTTNDNGDLIVDERVAVGGDSFFRPFIGSDDVYTQTPAPDYVDSDTITIELRVENYISDWNEGNINEIQAMKNLLEKNDAGGNFAGIPYFEKFFHIQEPPDGEPFGLLTTDAKMAGATRNIKPIMQQGWTAGLGADSPPILNHKFNYRYYDRADPESSEYNISVESQYNLFLDTSPDYESVIENVSEPLIPNFYHIEIAKNTYQEIGNFPESFVLIKDVDTDQYGTLLLAADSGSNINETQINSQGFYQYYTSNAENLKDDYRQNFGNVAVLSYDVANEILAEINGTIRDDRGTGTEEDDLLAIDSYPFYNKITIPYANQWAGNNIIETLIGWTDELNYEWVQNLITLLELLVIDQYKLGATGGNTPEDSVPFTIYDTEDNRLIANNLSVDLAVRLEDVLDALIDGQQTPPVQNNLYDLIESKFFSNQDYGTDWTSKTDFVGCTFILSNQTSVLENEEGNANVASRLYQWFTSQVTTTNLTDAKNCIASFRNGPTGEFQRIYQSRGESNNESNHLDTPLMYMVEKRVIPAGQLSVDATDSSTVVQRLFFGRDITGGEKGITYYDTQIKYGVRYQYDIKQVRIVVGESYYYDSVLSITNSGSVHQGRALGNVLGIYAEENVDITTTQTFQTANNLEDFEYTEEDSEPGSVRYNKSLIGYYVYKMAAAKALEDATNIDEVFGGPVPPAYPMYPIAGLSPSRPPQTAPFGPEITPLDNLLLEVKVGEGFEGNASGGAIATPISTLTAEDIVPASNPYIQMADEVYSSSEPPYSQLASQWRAVVRDAIGIEENNTSTSDYRQLWVNPFDQWKDLNIRTATEIRNLIDIFDEYREDVGGFASSQINLQGFALQQRVGIFVDDLIALGINLPQITVLRLQ